VTHTPQILAASRIFDRNVGAAYQAHPGTGIFGVYDEFVDPNTGATQGWASTQFRKSPGLKLETLAIPFEMVASRLSGGGSELMKRLGEYRHVAMWIHAIRAETKGRVVPTPGGKPLVFYSLNAADMLRFREGMNVVARMHFAAGAKKIIPGVHGLPYTMTADQLHLLENAPLDPRAYVAIHSHLFGGAIMGSDPKKSVCDGNGKVHSRERLWVVDGAVLPTTLGVNPQHTIMGVAQVFSERILDA